MRLLVIVVYAVVGVICARRVGSALRVALLMSDAENVTGRFLLVWLYYAAQPTR